MFLPEGKFCCFLQFSVVADPCSVVTTMAVKWQLTWVLLQCLAHGRPGTASQAEEVQEPYNLTVNSYNLNTTLHWDYNRMEMTPYFFVEILNKVEMNWMVIEACQNISHHYCDLSNDIIDSLTYYKVRVKAFIGSKRSRAAAVEFSLSSIGVIGPPELELHIEEKIILINIFHPEMPSIHDIENKLDNGALNYIVYCGNYTKEANACDSLLCTAEFPVSDEGTYCFSAQGISNHFVGIVMEKSKETCIHVAEGISKQTFGIIIGATVGVLAILAISSFIIARWIKPRAFMPQSLSSIARNIASYVQMPAQEIQKYSGVSISPPESPIGEKIYIEENKKIDADVSTNSVSKESTDPGYHSSLTENEQLTDERRDDQSNSSTYFHTDSSTSGSNSKDIPESEEAPMAVKPLPNSFGYDKPHFPKELI